MHRQEFICPACSGNEYDIAGSGITIGDKQSSIYRCKKCMTSSRFPKFDENELEKYYSKSGTFGKIPNWYGIRARKITAKHRIDTLASLLGKKNLALSDIAFLDIGAGIGLHLFEAKKKGFDPVLGIEPRKEVVEWGKKELRVEIINDIARKESLVSLFPRIENKKAVVVFFSHVFEHIANPSEFLNIFKELVKSNKKIYIFIEVPHTDTEIFMKGKTSKHLLWYQHQNSFSPQGLREFVEINGWKVDQVSVHTNYLRYWLRALKLRYSLVGKKPVKYFYNLANFFAYNITALIGSDCIIDSPKAIRLIASK